MGNHWGKMRALNCLNYSGPTKENDWYEGKDCELCKNYPGTPVNEDEDCLCCQRGEIPILHATMAATTPDEARRRLCLIINRKVL